MSKDPANRRWLATLRTADGAERHLSITGPPPPTLALPMALPFSHAMLMPSEPIHAEPARVRRYELQDVNELDGTAFYREDVR